MNSAKYTNEQVATLKQVFKNYLRGANKPLISFEGNIGAGKSTFANVFFKHLEMHNVERIEEPVEKWMNLEGENLLEKMYTDPALTFAFQTYVLVTMLDKGVSIPANRMLISERSIDSAL